MREIIEKKCLAVCIFPKCCSSLSGPTFPARILPLVKRRSLIFVPLNLGRHVRLRQVNCSRTFEAGLEKTVWFPLDSLSLSLSGGWLWNPASLLWESLKRLTQRDHMVGPCGQELSPHWESQQQLPDMLVNEPSDESSPWLRLFHLKPQTLWSRDKPSLLCPI